MTTKRSAKSTEPETDQNLRYSQLQVEVADRHAQAARSARRSDDDTAIRLANAHLPAEDVT